MGRQDGDEFNQEVDMSKRLPAPKPRLIRFGRARALTNAVDSGNKFEDEVSGPRYTG